MAKLHGGGGAFPDLLALLGGNQTLLDDVTEFFVCCYKRLGTDGDRWKGYDFGKRGIVSRRSYQEDFCSTLPTSVLCPYCDGEIQSPELDHYYHKTCFPLSFGQAQQVPKAEILPRAFEVIPELAAPGCELEQLGHSGAADPFTTSDVGALESRIQIQFLRPG